MKLLNDITGCISLLLYLSIVHHFNTSASPLLDTLSNFSLHTNIHHHTVLKILHQIRFRVRK